MTKYILLFFSIFILSACSDDKKNGVQVCPDGFAVQLEEADLLCYSIDENSSKLEMDNCYSSLSLLLNQYPNSLTCIEGDTTYEYDANIARQYQEALEAAGANSLYYVQD